MTRQTKEQFDKNKIKKLSESELTFQWSKYHPAISDTTINSKVLKNKSRCYSLFSRRAPPYWSDVTRDSQLGEVGASGKKNSDFPIRNYELEKSFWEVGHFPFPTWSSLWAHIEFVWTLYCGERSSQAEDSDFLVVVNAASGSVWIFPSCPVGAPSAGRAEEVQPREAELSTCNLTRRRSSSSIGHFGKEGAFLSPREGWRGVRKGQQSRAELSKGGQNSIRETRFASEPDTHFTCAKPEEILFNDAECNLTAERKRSLQENFGE